MTEIDAGAVERAWNAYRTTPGSFRDAIKAAIEAALSPKPEPEIEVTEGMNAAGAQAAVKYSANNPIAAPTYARDCCAEMYRAMESTRLKEAEKADQRLGPKDRRREYRITMHIRRLGSRFGRRSTDKTAYDDLPHAQEGAAYAAKDAPQGVLGPKALLNDAERGPRSIPTFGGWAHARKGGCNWLYHRRKDDPK